MSVCAVDPIGDAHDDVMVAQLQRRMEDRVPIRTQPEATDPGAPAPPDQHDRWKVLGAAADAAIPGRATSDSSALGWDTVHVRTYVEDAMTEAFEPARTDTVLIVLVRSGHYVIESRRGARWDSAVYRPGSMGSTLPGRVPVLRWRASSSDVLESVHVHLDPRLIRDALKDGLDEQMEAIDLLAFDDEYAASACRALGRAVQAGGSRLYADSVAMSLAVHLAQSSPLRVGAPGRSSGLASGPLTRVLDHMNGHLADQVSLDDLASVAHVSKHHFIREFKLATGLTPYAYLTDLRLKEGARLLRTDRTIDSIARLCGYRSASQFAKSFARAHGVSPSRFRRALP